MKSRKTIKASLDLSQTDHNFLNAIKEKTGAISNSEVLRNLIRSRYVQLSKTKLSKIAPGTEYIFRGVK